MEPNGASPKLIVKNLFAIAHQPNLDFVLLHVTNDDYLMEKIIWFMKIKFHLNETIESHLHAT